LTTQEKIMNMQKVGTFVQSNSGQQKRSNPRQYRASNVTRYTLCVFQGWQRRNGLRHGFAFDIPPIIGLTAAGPDLICHPAKKQQSGSHVIPGQSLMDETAKTHPETPPSLTGSGLQPLFTPKNNCSGFFPNLEQFYSGFALLVFTGYVSLAILLFRLGAPPWLVNLPALLVPSSLRRAGALAYRNGRTS
jgi:hypothetical protein